MATDQEGLRGWVTDHGGFIIGCIGTGIAAGITAFKKAAKAAPTEASSYRLDEFEGKLVLLERLMTEHASALTHLQNFSTILEGRVDRNAQTSEADRKMLLAELRRTNTNLDDTQAKLEETKTAIRNLSTSLAQRG